MPSPPEVAELPDAQSLLLLTAREALGYFLNDELESGSSLDTHAGGLVLDSARPGSPCSIAAAGFAATVYAAAHSLGLIDRGVAARRTRDIVDAFSALNQSKSGAGVHGYYYHFLENFGKQRGKRAWRCELSSIDTALLVAGLLVAAAYFDGEDEDEAALRDGATAIYERVEWPFLLRPNGVIGHGWYPPQGGFTRSNCTKDGYIRWDWRGYNEGLLLYLLALGSPTHPIPAESYAAWCSTYPDTWTELYGIEYLHSPPLFVHQFPQAFVDFRGIRDRFNRDRDFDYFEQARRAMLIQIEYAKQNPHDHIGYSKRTWGISASNGPGNLHRKQLDRDGRKRRYFAYCERGIAPPAGVVDDGTLAPWAVAASLPFLPDEVTDGITAHRDVMLCRPDWAGFMGSYNLNYVSDTCPHGWVDEHDLAIEQAPIVIMIANHLTDAIWSATRKSRPFIRGLQRAGFTGGWLDDL